MLDLRATSVIEVAATAGFGTVGLRLSGEHAVADAAAIAAVARDLGVAVHDCEVYRISDDAIDPTPLLEASAAAGASRVLVVSDLADRAATVDAVADLVERCRPLRLTVGLEYMAWTDPCDPLEAVGVSRRTGCVVVVDVLHHVRVGAGVAELDAIVASGRLGWVQLCDAVGRTHGGDRETLIHEARHRRLPPGAGDLPLRALMARVPAGVTISVEVQSDALSRRAPLERARLLFDSSSAVLAQSNEASTNLDQDVS